jgi:PKD repeat protein
MLSKLSIDDRTKNSPTIIDGQVIAQHAYWNAEKSSIFTVNTVMVNTRLKGSSQPTIEIITPGGELDGKLLVVEPNAELRTGSKGIFFLKDNTVAFDFASSVKQYEIYSLAQGFIEEDEYTGKYNDPFEEYANRTVVYGLIGKTTGMNLRLGNTSNAMAVSSGTVTGFSPSTISAGTQSVLTINGTGFGVRKPSSTVQFRDANSTNSSNCVSVPDSSYILSWTNTQIKVIVPGASAFRQGGSGSGVVKVIDGDGNIITSSMSINISYNQFEYKKRRIALIGQNGSGGYTFTLNSNFSGNTNAKETFQRALDQWRCSTGVNAIISSSTTSTVCNSQSDNMNVVSFADANCPLPAGALGTTYSTYSLCSNSPIMPDGMDMIFNPDANFYMGTAAPASNQYDFESVALHELGHAFGQGHHSSGTEVMYPSIANGFTKRVLNPASDIANIKEVISLSTAAVSTCGFSKFTAVAPCAVSFTANFTADKFMGCAPLTINFTDKTTGSPTQWKWDIDNNGTVDYTAQNPSHTFTTPGHYSIKLIASNAASKDSIIKLAQIYVTPPMNLTLSVPQNVSCYGGTNGSVNVAATGGDGNYTYSWTTSQTTAALSNVPAGNYKVTVKDGSNCQATANGNVTQPDAIAVNVNTAPSGSTYSATLDATGGVKPYTYILNSNSGSRIESTSSTISNLTAGNYTVSVKDNNSCVKNTSFAMSSPTPVTDNENQFDNLDVYPNPATTNVNFNLTLKEEKTVKVEMFDLSGRTVFQDEYSNIKDKQASVDLSAFANGTYIIRFGLPEGNTFRKIIVSR